MKLFGNDFPIKVVLWRRFDNTITPFEDQAKYLRTRKNITGGFVDEDYLILKKLKKKIPAIDIKYYYDIEDMDKNKKYRLIHLLELDIDTIYPLKFERDGWFTVVKSPVLDDNGEPVLDENGKPKIETVERRLIDLNIAMTKNNEIIKMPQAMVVSTYDKQQWLTLENTKDMQFYKTRGVWETWGKIFAEALVLGFIVVVFWLGMKYTSEQYKMLTESNKIVAESNAKIIADTQKILNSLGNIQINKQPTPVGVPPI